ncbi:MAG: glycosyltransferase [Planctomycetes bacterium]|nr:glycosyltransferase [Planctomycetota bacterium]
MPREFTCSNPGVSVLLPVYNSASYLRESIESILNQSFKEFELLIICEPCTDGSIEIIKSYKDSRIIHIQNEKRLGLANSLNKGIELARGEYIARMDADDVSLPERFAAQVMFMEKCPEIGICGTWMVSIGKHSGKSWKPPIDDATMRCQLLFNSPLGHPAVMMRRSLFTDLNLQYPAYAHAEDYALWVQASRYTTFANIPEILLSYRHHDGQVSKGYRKEQIICNDRVHRDLLERLGMHPTEEEIELHSALGEVRFLHDRKFIARANDWLMRLDLANQRSKTYQEPNFSRVLSERRFWRFPLKMPLMASVQLAILTLCPPRVYTALRKLWRVTHPHG